MKNKFVTKPLIFLSALSFLSAPAFVMAKESKVALVIGNSKYAGAPLKNPVNDAKDMKTALEKAGFTVIYADDAGIDEMDEATNKFLNALDHNSLGLFFYSGHGVQAGGVNYLIPVDAKITNESTLKRQSYDVNSLVVQLESIGNSSNILILDACRDNPYEQKAGTKSFANVSKGLAEIKNEADSGLMIAYATASGKVASDNQKGKNGLYTKYLKQYLFQSGLTVEAALKKVRQAVVKENPDQIPWDNSSLIDDVCLGGCTSPIINPVTSEQLTSSSPLLSFVSGANSVNQNKSYTVKFKGTDADGDLSKILVDWGDGSAITSKTAKENTALSLSHTYKFAGIYDLIATAIDKQNAESETYSQEVQVKEVAVPPVTPPIVVSPVTPPVVVKIPDISNANASPSSITQGSIITFNVKLSATLPNGYSVKIDYGSGLAQMKGSNTSFSLIVTPKNLGSSLFTVGIYDNSGNLKSNSMTGNYSVSELVVIIPPLEEPVVTKTTGYSKIANNGSTLADSAKLGANSTDWACTKDNKTGLIWEVKTTDGGLRDWKSYYSWYKPEGDNGGNAGYQNGNGHPEWCKGSDCDTYAFTNAINAQGLCGNNDWRMPTIDELKGLLATTSTVNQPLNEKLYIDANYFPNTNYWYWSSSPDASSSDYAWKGFVNGYSSGDFKYYYFVVRLVR